MDDRLKMRTFTGGLAILEMEDADGRRRRRDGASRQTSIGAKAGALAQRPAKAFVSEREKKDEANVKRRETRRQ